MNVEQRLICKIIKSGDYRTVQQAGIKPSMFRSAEARQMFKAIRTYFNNKGHYGKVPKRDWMKDRFPSFEYIKVREGLDELCEILRVKAMERKIEGALEEVSQTLEGEGPQEALTLLRSKMMEIQTMIPNSRDIILAESARELIEEYKNVKQSDGVLGVPWPWEELNIQTQGMLDGEFIVLYGRLKSMKTWIAILIAVHAYAVGNRRVLFCSCEMPPAQVRRRVAAVLCGLDYDLLKKAKLPRSVRVEYFRRLKKLKVEEKRNATRTHKRSFLITTDKANPAGGGVQDILAKAEQFKPHLVIVDSYYRMRDDRTGKRSLKWEVQAGITQDMKNMAQILEVPVLGTTQKNREKGDDSDEGMDDISYTDAAGQETDFGLKIVKNGIDPSGNVSLTAWIAGAREIKTDGFALSVLPATTWEWMGWIKRTGKVGEAASSNSSIGKKAKNRLSKVKSRKSEEDFDDIHLDEDEEYET